MLTIHPIDSQTISVHITNLSAEDAQFLGGVIRYFTDPAKNLLAQQLRSGQVAIMYAPTTGAAALVHIFARQ